VLGRQFALFPTTLRLSPDCAERGSPELLSITRVRLARVWAQATLCSGISFNTIVTAERAGYYKPDPRPYRLALDELHVEPQDCLFVAGSPYDLFGAAAVALPVF
jgi:phosphoglycolate phosphatase-like HAD superfamily hydrolase